MGLKLGKTSNILIHEIGSCEGIIVGVEVEISGELPKKIGILPSFI